MVSKTLTHACLYVCKHVHNTHTHLIKVVQQLVNILVISVGILIVEVLSHHDHDIIGTIMLSLQHWVD